MICQSPRDLPSVSKLLEQEETQALVGSHGEELVKFAVRDALDEARRDLLRGSEVALARVTGRIAELLSPAQQRVLNLTGTILHTNLGRAPLGDLLTTVAERLKGYSVLEFDLQTGKRGKRGEAVERLLRWTTGAEAAVMVNNCASAMLLLLTVMAKGKEVIVSRGELVEIGGSFRIPDILSLSGCRLVEVGTTNRTRVSDYEAAITEETGLLLSTHRSNFEIVGFTQSPEPGELIELGKKHGIPVAYDLGSGMLSRLVPEEPLVSDCSGFSLTAFSGDKLLGGPQCGIIIGQKEFVTRCRRHPFYRAFRCDKLTLALMEEVLRRHAGAPHRVPTASLLLAEQSALRERAERTLSRLKPFLPEHYECRVVDTVARVGGGTLPGGELPSVALALSPPAAESEKRLQDRFREGQPPIIVRVEKGTVYLDFRSLPESDDEEFLESCRRIFT